MKRCAKRHTSFVFFPLGVIERQPLKGLWVSLVCFLSWLLLKGLWRGNP